MLLSRQNDFLNLVEAIQFANFDDPITFILNVWEGSVSYTPSLPCK